jgi:hypothetical protein
LTTGGTTAFPAAEAACCAQSETAEQIKDRSQTLRDNFIRDISILLFYDVNRSRKRTYLANLGSIGDIEKEREKTTEYE